MPTINTTGWQVTVQPESRFLQIEGEVKLPVYVKWFAGTNHDYALVYPQGRLAGDHWKGYLNACRKGAMYDPKNRFWVWTRLTLEKATTENTTIPAKVVTLTQNQRELIRAQRKQAEVEFEAQLLELSRAENVPEDLWPTYSYPPHLKPGDPAPTALQRIAVSRYWNQPSALLGASVGAGKSRMIVDMMSARALADSEKLNNSVRITLLVAPLTLHENWRREFEKWKRPGVVWHVHRFQPTEEFWSVCERSASTLFDGKSMLTGGLVIICTPNALSRTTLSEQFKERGYVPTAIVIDECQRFFRKPDNKAFLHITKLRRQAHICYGLSGTPTSKFEDWWALEELISNGAADAHWKFGTYQDYVRLGDKEQMTSSGLWEPGWTFERAIKEFHADRIRKARVFMADKFFYMKDSLPGIDQQEMGEFADLRLSFHQLFEGYKQYADAAIELQKSCNENFKGSEASAAQVLLLRMQQCAAMSENNRALLKEWVADSLEKDEPAVIWTMFRNEPCEELQDAVRYLSTIAPTGWIMGGMKPEQRQAFVDGFASGALRFLVCQVEAAGVGLNLVRASKSFFSSIPFGYQTVCQCIGRQHRIGQINDVTSYFAMTHPVAAFARSIYDRRTELNEVIPQKISGILAKLSIDVAAAPS